MQVLYQLDAWGRFEAHEEGLANFKASFAEELSAEAEAFAAELCAGFAENRELVDGAIQAASDNWRLSRMSRVDRSLLRLAAYEILCCPEIPDRVAINEAVDLGKRFGSEDTRQFLNGVLDRIARDHTA